jgi:hypothetical protein
VTARRRCDPFELLCRQAAGRSIPEPPAIPGRSFVQRMGAFKDADPLAEAWDHRRLAAAVAESTTAKARMQQGPQTHKASDPPASPPPIPEPGEVAPGLHTSALTT